MTHSVTVTVSFSSPKNCSALTLLQLSKLPLPRRASRLGGTYRTFDGMLEERCSWIGAVLGSLKFMFCDALPLVHHPFRSIRHLCNASKLHNYFLLRILHVGGLSPNTLR